MRHGVKGRTLSRPMDERKALRRTLLTQLFEHGKIRTTIAKAKFVRGDAEKMITIAKRGLKATTQGDETAGKLKKFHAHQILEGRLNGKAIVKKLFDDIAPRYVERKGGYTRVTRIGLRAGDASEMVLLELVED